MARPVCLDDFEKYAIDNLPRNALYYYSCGANNQVTLKDNIEAFKRWRLVPRVLVDVSQRDLTTSILGHRVSFPVCIAPTGMHGMAHPEGEMATAKGAADMGTAFCLSTTATSSIEQIAEGNPDVLRFFQLYVLTDRKLSKQLVQRAERNGFKAIFLTIDAPIDGIRPLVNRVDFKLPSHLKLANHSYLGFEHQIEHGKSSRNRIDPSLSWNDVKWLKSITNLPIVLKGVLTAADAENAVSCGVSGIVVSNHGGRQLDTIPATIDALPEVVAAVRGRCEVYLDGGVRCGTDVLKAIALGAKAVFIGRPAIYGLAYDGSSGVAEVLRILQDEFSTAMAFTGCTNVTEITRELVRHQSHYLSRM